MHELGIAGEILSAALAEAKKHNATRILSVTVRVGVLRSVVPEHLTFLFRIVSRDTAASEASLRIEEEPLRVECPACGVTESRVLALACPSCGSGAVRADGGESLALVSMEIDV